MSHRRRRCQADRIADLPDARRITATAHRGANDVEDGALTLSQTGVVSASAGVVGAWRAFALVAAVVAHGAECSPYRSNNQTCVRGVSRLDVWPDRAAVICRWAVLVSGQQFDHMFYKSNK